MTDTTDMNSLLTKGIPIIIVTTSHHRIDGLFELLTHDDRVCFWSSDYGYGYVAVADIRSITFYPELFFTGKETYKESANKTTDNRHQTTDNRHQTPDKRP